MHRKPGYRNEKELSEKEIDEIIEEYYKCELSVSELSEKFKLTKRALPKIFKARGIKSSRKNRYKLNDSYFHKIDTEEKAYWLGYLYADGYVGDEYFNNIVFSQKISDGDMIKQFAADIEFTGQLKIRTPGIGTFNNGQEQIIINFSSKEMAQDLRDLKMFPNKSMEISELPPIEESLMRHFIRGYFDGDGSVTETIRDYNKGREYHSYIWSIIGTKTFNEKIAELLPIKTSMRDSKTPQMKYLTASSIQSMITMFHYFYDEATRFLPRKRNVFLKAIRYDHEKPWLEKRDKP